MKQRMKLPSSGSVFNWMMSNNSSEPKVGEYATIMHYTDRNVCIVRSVDLKKKEVVIEHCHTKADTSKGLLQMGHQNWVHEPNGHTQTLKYLYGGWKIVKKEVRFTKEYTAKFPDMTSLGNSLTPEQLKIVYGEEAIPQNVLPGITELYRTLSPIKILFGECDYHYDWEF